MQDIESEKLWKRIFPPKCYKNFWSPRCLDELGTGYVLNSWEIFARCPHAFGCAVAFGFSYEDAKRNQDTVEKNRIVNLKIARRRVY